MGAEEGSICVICHESFLDSPVGALKCGHVYHRNCIVLWFAEREAHKLASECPQCKKRCRMDHVRTLAFEVKQIPGYAPEELRRLEALSLEECEASRTELCDEKASLEATVSESEMDLAALSILANDFKSARDELESEISMCKEEQKDASAEYEEEKTACFSIQAGLDAEEPRWQKKMPIKRTREGDVDVRDERRRVRSGMKVADRARLLDETVSSAMQQESEKIRDTKYRDEASRKAEAELMELRQLEAQTRRDLDERQSAVEEMQRRSTAASPLSSQVSSQSLAPSSQRSAVSSSGALTAERSSSSTAPVLEAASMKVVTPLGKRQLPAAEDDEEDMLLFGSISTRRPANGIRPGSSVLGGLGSKSAPALGGAASAAAKPGGGKWGALFGRTSGGQTSHASTALPTLQPVQSARSAHSKPNTLKSIFDRRA